MRPRHAGPSESHRIRPRPSLLRNQVSDIVLHFTTKIVIIYLTPSPLNLDYVQCVDLLWGELCFRERHPGRFGL